MAAPVSRGAHVPAFVSLPVGDWEGDVLLRGLQLDE
jgi:hypothetical protein